jgi:hypothetical protein
MMTVVMILTILQHIIINNLQQNDVKDVDMSLFILIRFYFINLCY